MYYNKQSKIDAPLAHVLSGGDHAVVVQLADAADQTAATDQDLALAAGVAGERLAHQVHDAFGSDAVSRLDVILLASLLPDATGKVDVLLLAVVPNLAGCAKEEGLLHAQSHIVDCGFLLVAHRPAHLLVGEALQSGLFHLHLEDLAQVAALLGQGFELGRLYIQLAGSASHAHQLGAFQDVGDAIGYTADGGAVDSHDGHAVLVAAQDVEHQVILALGRAVALISRCLLGEDSVGGVKDFVVVGMDNGGGGVSARSRADYIDVLHQASLGGLGVHAVEINDHATGVLAASVARDLVNGCRHGADFHNLLVYLVEQQVR